MKKVAMFIDGANMFYAQKDELKWFIDFERLYKYFTRDSDVYNAFYYTGVKGVRFAEKQRFLDALTHIGYTVRKKPVKRILDTDTGEFKEKCNLDIEMVIDMFNTVHNYDIAILFSGDGDFERAVELLRSKGKEIVAVSTRGRIAKELVNAVDRYVDLRGIRSAIERTE